MKSPLDKAVQRAKTYWQIDGLVEIGFGLILAFLGLYFYLDATLDSNSNLHETINSMFFLLMVTISILVSKGISWFKQRITYPRTGYVEYPKKKGSTRWIAMLSSGLIALLISVFLASAPKSLDWMPLLAGGVLTIVLLMIALRGASARFYLLAVLSLAAGLGLSLLGIGNFLGAAYYYWIMTLALFASGGITLLLYLRSAPQPAASI